MFAKYKVIRKVEEKSKGEIKKMKKMKLKVKLSIDIAMLLTFLVNIFTGFALFFGLVHGDGGGYQYRGSAKISYLNFTDLGNDLSTKTLFRLFHDWSGILFVILVLVHLILNWNTLWCYFRNILKKPEYKLTNSSNITC